MNRTAIHLAGGVALCGLVFALDRAVPLGVAVGAAYVLPIGLALTAPWSGQVWAITALAVTLTFADWAVSEPAAVPWMAGANRLLSVLVQCVTAGGVFLQRRALARLAAERDERKRMELVVTDREALARLGEMAAAVAHEVKNPLAGISGALQVLGERFGPASPERGLVQSMRARIAALDTSLSEVLRFAKAREPRIERVALRDIATRAASVLSRDTAWSGIAVQVEGGHGWVLADSELLSEALYNLLLNASQAMDGNGRVDVAVGERDGWCEVAVRDRGPGVPPEARSRVWDPFFSTRPRGIGLGLANVRRTVEAHGGHVEIEDAPGGGATVRMALPADSQAAVGGTH